MSKLFFLLLSIFGFSLIDAMDANNESAEDNTAVNIPLSLQQDKKVSNESTVPYVVAQRPVFSSIRAIGKPIVFNNSKPLRALSIQAPTMQRNVIAINSVEINESIISNKLTTHLTRHSKTIGNRKKK